MDLTSPSVRAGLVDRLGELYAGRPVILGPAVLAAHTPTVAALRERGCRVLVLATARGAGPVPGPDECTVVELETPTTRLVTDELRLLDHLAHHLPDHAVAAIERFDPAGEAVWNTGHFVSDDEPILGRRVVGGRPASYLRMEDKLFAEQVWAACNVPTAPHLVVPVEEAALAEATAALAGPLGTVWTGDARDGFHGAGNYVRWVHEEADLAVAQSFFSLHCDRIRVMPFLDGVPCSIHGLVFPDGTAVLRPVEIVVLRKVGEREFVYGGLSSYWDPPEADRAEMRSIARRVGSWLQAEHGYRGAFGIDGVLTADGFRPTELNTRLPAGAVRLADLDPELFELLQTHLVAGLDTGVNATDLEALVPLMDAGRSGRPVAIGQGVSLGTSDEYDLAWDGVAFTRAEGTTGNTLVLADTPSGFFAKVSPCAVLSPGDRLAPVNAALMAYLDREYDTGFGAVEAAPDLR
ncbi:hypothetical protein [Nocardioides sp.]|uniref:hypothetical protein n=1 Tax=Nocardioides sp. TaxID=35761 RepID=UPI002D7F2290|nr:hypothetical protein [Nocardioides sp.]HET8960211.1 hypothetical protein [Nocardioides sp.]